MALRLAITLLFLTTAVSSLDTCFKVRKVIRKAGERSSAKAYCRDASQIPQVTSTSTMWEYVTTTHNYEYSQPVDTTIFTTTTDLSPQVTITQTQWSRTIRGRCTGQPLARRDAAAAPKPALTAPAQLASYIDERGLASACSCLKVKPTTVASTTVTSTSKVYVYASENAGATHTHYQTITQGHQPATTTTVTSTSTTWATPSAVYVQTSDGAWFYDDGSVQVAMAQGLSGDELAYRMAFSVGDGNKLYQNGTDYFHVFDVNDYNGNYQHIWPIKRMSSNQYAQSQAPGTAHVHVLNCQVKGDEACYLDCGSFVDYNVSSLPA
jgi:hypothetical protein